MKNKKGVTALEALVILAMTAVLILLALPNLLEVRGKTQEERLRALLRAFHAANQSYRSSQADRTFAPSIQILAESNPRYLDPSWQIIISKTHTLAYQVGEPPSLHYSLLANPKSSERAYYCIDHNGVLYKSREELAAGEQGCTGGEPVIG